MESTQVPKSLLTLGNLRRVVARRYEGERVQPALEAIFARMTGGHSAALLLSRVVYWQAHVLGDTDQPFYRSNSEWVKETELSLATVKRALPALKPAGVCIAAQTPGYGYTKVNHYSLDVQRFLQAFADALTWTVDQVTSTLRDLIELILVRLEPAQAQSEPNEGSERPQHTAQNEPGRGVKVTPTEESESYTESSSEIDPESQPLSGARARDEATAGVGVSEFDVSSLKNIFQVTSDAPGWTREETPTPVPPPPSPLPQWALDIARHAAHTGRLRNGDLEAYALGVVARRAGVKAETAKGYRPELMVIE